VPQVPLDAIPAVAPEVSYQDGLLTIVAPNSTLADILRGVRKHTAADIEIPSTASERVVTRLGPGPAREVMAELLNGSRFNYILLGSPDNANLLVRVVLVAKTSDAQSAGAAAGAAGAAQSAQVVGAATEAPDAEAADDAEDTAEPGTAEAEQPAATPDQPGVRTPQQMLQEMQQRQLQMQQQSTPAQSVPAQPGILPSSRPGAAIPQGQPQQQSPDQQP